MTQGINEFYLVYGVAIALGFSRKEAWGIAERATRGAK